MRYEIHPVRFSAPRDAPANELIECDADDPRVAFWSIYDRERSGDGTLTWVADFDPPDRDAAEQLCAFLNENADELAALSGA